MMGSGPCRTDAMIHALTGKLPFAVHSKDCLVTHTPAANPPDTESVTALQATVSRLEAEHLALTQARVENEKSIAFLTGILEQSLAGIYVINKGKFEYVNQVFADIFGYASPAEVMQTVGLLDLVSPECRSLVLENVRKRTVGETNEVKYTFAGLRKDGSRNLVEVHGRAMETAGARVVIGLLLDITHFERATTLAFYDSLTHLPNRALFHDRLAQTIKQAQRNQDSFAVLFMDLDGFKHTNDTLGHAAGDHVLQEFSKRLVPLFRESDTVARLGGDEFVALMPCEENGKTPAQRAARIIQCLEPPIQFNGQAIAVGVSIGISVFPPHGTTAESLIQGADAAMYEAKKSGKNTYRMAQPPA